MPDLVLHRALLRLYPRSFRERRGGAVLELARAEAHRARSIGGFTASLVARTRTALDLVVNLPLAWHDAVREQPRCRSAGMNHRSLEALALDTRLALRRLLRAPGFTAAAVLTLGIALGAATAVFGLIDQVLLRPLPYPHADRLVALWESEDGRDISVSWPNFEDWNERLRSFDELAAYSRTNLTLTGAGDAARLRGLGVTANLLGTVGLEPHVGRWFGPGADRADGPAEVVLTHALWTERFGGDRAVLGSSLMLDGAPYQIVGVAPPGFRFPDGIVLISSDFFVPLGPLLGDEMTDRDSHPGLYGLGRLRPETDLDMARAELDALSIALEAEYPDVNTGYRIRSEGALDAVVGDAGSTLLLVAIAVGLVLVVAAANVSGLFLARGWAREADTGVQLALGAGRARLARQVIIESILVGLGAAAAGVAASWFALRAATPILEGLPRAPAPSVDLRIAGFALVGAITVGVLVGVLPALRTPRGRTLGEGSRSVAGGRREGRLRDLLVAAEVALAVVLVVGATLLTRSLRAVEGLDAGIRTADVLTFGVGLPDVPYDEPELAISFYDRLIAEMSSLPGVQAVGGVSVLPLSGSGSQSGIAPIGGGPDTGIPTDVAVVLSGYFEALEIELIRGRLFDDNDRAGAGVVGVVDERFARTFFGDEDPVGQSVQGWGFEAIEIVGVVRHVKHYGVLQTSREQLYIPHAQRPFRNMHLVARTESDPLGLVPATRERLSRLDPSVPLSTPSTMEERVARTLRGPRTAAILGSTMAGLGALLSLVGVYALVAYAVSRRRREIGLRMALGASGGSVRSSMLLRTLRPALGGVAAGMVMAAVASRGLRAWIHGVSALDPASFLFAGGGLMVVILVAGAIPARRITSVDPVQALRSD